MKIPIPSDRRRPAARRWLAAIALSLAAPVAQAQLSVDITRGNIEPLPIAVPDFQGTAPNEKDFGRRIGKVLA